MEPSLRLGRIAGTEIGLNWSWLVVFALLVWTLATGIFPSTNPRLSAGAHLGMAPVASALFFCSLLLHELGHALRARRDALNNPRVKQFV
jgi:Zn-dependent protease